MAIFDFLKKKVTDTVPNQTLSNLKIAPFSSTAVKFDFLKRPIVSAIQNPQEESFATKAKKTLGNVANYVLWGGSPFNPKSTQNNFLEKGITNVFNRPGVAKFNEKVSKSTEDIPLRVLSSIGSARPESAYQQALESFKISNQDENSPTWKKFLSSVQNSAGQTGLGVALSFIPYAGKPLSSAYWAMLSAEEQKNNKGQVTNPGNIAIDVVGDRLLGNTLEGLFKQPINSLRKQLVKTGFVEGTTEPGQSVLKYANDYQNAQTPEERSKIVEEAKRYVTSGDILMEAAVGGVTGAGIGGTAYGLEKGVEQYKNLTPEERQAGKIKVPFVDPEQNPQQNLFNFIKKPVSEVVSQQNLPAAERIESIQEEVPGLKPANELSGESKPVYHGTLEEFDTFDDSKAGSNTGWENAKFGTFFLDDATKAKEFTEISRSAGDKRPVNVKEAYIDLKNPIDLTRKGIFRKKEQAPIIVKLLTGEDMSPEESLEYLNDNIGLGEMDELKTGIYGDIGNKKIMQDAGFDGIISDYGDGITEKVVFDTRQIKTKAQKDSSISLTEEAKKYKSAEEFVKAQKSLYHGTDKNFTEFKGGTTPQAGGGVFLSESKQISSKYGKNVIDAYPQVKNPLNIGKGYDVPMKVINDPQKYGYDALVKHQDDGSIFEMKVFNPENVKTKSQLTDIYNQATKVDEKTQFSKEAKAFKDGKRIFPKLPKINSKTKGALMLTEQTLDDIATKINNGGNYEMELSFAEEALDNNQLSDFEKYADMEEGTLPEVTGKPKYVQEGNRKLSRSKENQNRFAVEGDQMITEYGYDDTEQFREDFEKYLKQKARVEKLRAEVLAIKKGRYLLGKAKSERRAQLRILKDAFNLTDSELKTVRDGRNIIDMEDDEFADFMARAEVEAEKLEQTRKARVQVEATIQQKELKKVENLQKALELPTIDEMSMEQLQEFDKLLSQYQFGDEFLGVRKLQTIDRTLLEGVKTYREAKDALAKKLSKKYGKEITPQDLVVWGKLDSRYKWDSVLAEQSPFFKLLVESVNAALLGAENNVIDIQEDVNKLMKRVQKGKSFMSKLVPMDDRIIGYLEAEDKGKYAKYLTKDEYAAATYMQEYFTKALQYLYDQKALLKSRFEDIYYPHMRRGFLEALADTKGSWFTKFKEGWKAILEKQKLDKMIIDILDQKTGQILPMDKYFKYVAKREGQNKYSKNATKIFLEYAKMFEAKKALDAMIPEVMTYVDVLTPRKQTRTGLEMDDKLKSFVTEYINNKKGRKADFVFSQGSTPDNILKSVAAFLSLRDLGVNIPVQVGSNFGAQGGVYTMLGPVDYAKGLIRYGAMIAESTKKVSTETGRQAKAIADQAKSFTGVNPWSELADISKDIGSKIYSAMFALFRDAVVRANQQFLLGSLTDEEWNSGKISNERLAELKIKAGRWLPMEKAESIRGSTTVGKSATKYKGWAITMAYRAIKNLADAIKILSKKGASEAIKSQEFKELVNASMFTSVVALVSFATAQAFKDDEDEPQSFISKIRAKMINDGMSFIAALSPKTLFSVPRLLTFLGDLSVALTEIIKIEDFKPKFNTYQKDGKGYEKGDNKGIDKLGKTLKPTLFNNISDLLPEGSKKSAIKLPSLNKKLPKLPKLNTKKLPTLGDRKPLPKLPKLKKKLPKLPQ